MDVLEYYGRILGPDAGNSLVDGDYRETFARLVSGSELGLPTSLPWVGL